MNRILRFYFKHQLVFNGIAAVVLIFLLSWNQYKHQQHIREAEGNYTLEEPVLIQEPIEWGPVAIVGLEPLYHYICTHPMYDLSVENLLDFGEDAMDVQIRLDLLVFHGYIEKINQGGVWYYQFPKDHQDPE